MNPIKVLDQNTIDKIAAGEVVERPSSIVKELTENAIDAGASRITIEIKDGGISLIRVTDDGKGIPQDEIRLAFLRHATSKIDKVEDLDSIRSLGFRGEALSSVAAVSRTELFTKQAEDMTGTRYVIEGGREKLLEEVGAPDGTTMIVRDLFYNTPARSKFLKSPITEAAHVGSFVEQLMLSNPEIAFTFTVNGQTKASTTGSGSLKDVIYHIYGRDLASELLWTDFGENGVGIGGCLAKPSVSRGNRNFENYYVNGRYVKSRVIQSAIEEGYGNKLMQHQYPFTCLTLSIRGNLVDVNVHPTKMEVRFSDDRTVFNAVLHAVQKTLADREMIIRASLNPPEKPDRNKPDAVRNEKLPEPFEKNALKEQAERSYGSQNPAGAAFSKDVSQLPESEGKKFRTQLSEGKASQIPLSEEKTSQTPLPEGKASQPPISDERTSQIPPADGKASQIQAPEKKDVLETEEQAESGKNVVYEQQSFKPKFLSPEAAPLRRIIGAAFNTYWIVEYEDSLFLIDQHAAHEKVLFTRLMKDYEKSAISSQMLCPPVVLSTSLEEQALLEAYLPAFWKIGFEIEPFGGRDYKISAVPYHLSAINSRELFISLLDSLEGSHEVKNLDIFVHRVATEACKAAVKGGGEISFAEAKYLIDELFRCDDPYHCPHGRPTIISLTKSDLEKKFKRII